MLSNKMDVCYLLDDVQEIRIQPYFCVKQGDYFFHFFETPCILRSLNFRIIMHHFVFYLYSKVPWHQCCVRFASGSKFTRSSDNLTWTFHAQQLLHILPSCNITWVWNFQSSLKSVFNILILNRLSSLYDFLLNGKGALTAVGVDVMAFTHSYLSQVFKKNSTSVP